MHKQTNGRAYLAAAGMVFAFGLTFLFSKIAMDYVPMYVVLSLRFSTSVLTLLAMHALRLIKLDLHTLTRRDVRELLLVALPYPVLSFSFEMLGIQYASTAQGGIMVALMPVMTALFGVMILKERPRVVQWLFVFCSVGGVLIKALGASGSDDTGSLIGILFFLIANSCGSLSTVLSRRASRHCSPFTISFFMACCGAVAFTLIAVVQGLASGTLLQGYAAAFTNPAALGSLAYLGIVASGFGFLCLNYMMATLPAVRAGIFGNVAAIVSIIAGVLILHEPLHGYQVLGAVFILVGVVGTNVFAPKTQPTAPEPSEQPPADVATPTPPAE